MGELVVVIFTGLGYTAALVCFFLSVAWAWSYKDTQ